MIAASVTGLAWMDTIAAAGRPVLVVAEGLLMYLDEVAVRQLVRWLHETFPGCRLIADVFNRLTARSVSNHPSLKQTGATIGWGIDDPHELESWAPGIHLLEEWYFTDDPDLARLSLGYRLAYKLAGTFKMVTTSAPYRLLPTVACTCYLPSTQVRRSHMKETEG